VVPPAEVTACSSWVCVIDPLPLLSIAENMFCATWVGEVPGSSPPSAPNREASASLALLPAAAPPP